MEKTRFSIGPFDRRKLLFAALASVVLVTAVFLTAAYPQEGKADKREIARQVAKKWIQNGADHHRKGLFEASERALLRALDYQEYLTAAEREKLNELLERTHNIVVKRKQIQKHIQAARELIEQGKLIEAKAHLEGVKDSELLTEAEAEQVAKGLAKIDSQTGAQKEEIAEIYNRSVELFNAGQLEKARAGFIKVAGNRLLTAPVGKSAEDYLAKIEKILSEKVEPAAAAEAKPAAKKEEGEEVVVAPDETVAAIEEELLGAEGEAAAEAEEAKVEEAEEGKSFIEVVNRKRKILQSHTGAVVNDTITKVQDFIRQGRFDQAYEATEMARAIVDKNELYLGAELFEQYIGRLKELRGKIAQKQEKRTEQLEEQKHVEAMEEQRRYREQMEAERNKTIAELMDNALSCQQQQRYKASLGQLESLLELDPQNQQALIMKQTMVDMISAYEQLEVKKEADRQQVSVMKKTDEAMTPYAEDIEYPKDWLDIVAKRVPEPEAGDPEDLKVYQRLEEQIVDLSALTPVMPFGEAIELLKNSVDPPLKVTVMWGDLSDNAAIDRTTPINMDPIPEVTLGRALELLLEVVSGGFAELGYTVKEGIIRIATKESLPSEWATVVYDVSEVLSTPAGMGGGMGMMGGGMGMMGGGMGMMGGGYGGGMGMMGGRGGYGGGMGMMGGRGGYGGGRGGFGGGRGGFGGGRGGFGGGRGGYGGGGYGGRGGGYGGGGMGMMGGGMGMMGGGRGGYGGGRGGYGGGMGMGMGMDMSYQLSFDIEQILYDSVDIETWQSPDYLEAEGTIQSYGTPVKNLVIKQTPENHKIIRQVLEDIRKALGHDRQVAIEARFLLVSEEFMENIGLDLDFIYYPSWSRKITSVTVEQEHASWVEAVGGATAGLVTSQLRGVYGTGLDSLQATLLLRAAQAHEDTRTINAPKVTVLSGENANIMINKEHPYIADYEFEDITAAGIDQPLKVIADPVIDIISSGVMLNVTPTITADNKYVLLLINTSFTEVELTKDTEKHIPSGGGTEQLFPIQLPLSQIADVQTRVAVPDGGTLLIGGQKIGRDSEMEAGIPVLSKIPFIGRAFSNRGKAKRQSILLILVKPTIMLRSETEDKAVAEIESGLESSNAW